MVKKWKELEIRKKLVIIIITLGLFPAFIISGFFSVQMEKMSQEKQEYIMNQNFDMILSSVKDRMERMQEVAAYLTVEDSVSSLFYQDFGVQSPEQRLRVYDEIEKISRQYMETSNLDDIRFYLGENRCSKKSVGSRFLSLNSIVSQAWYQEFLAQGKKCCFTVLNREGENDHSLAFVRAIWNPEDYQQMEGTVVTVIDPQQFTKELVSIDEGQVIYLECDGSIVSSNAFSKAEQFQSGLSENGEDPSRGLAGEYYCIRQEIDRTGVWLISILKKEAIYAEINHALQYNTGLFLIVICVIAAFSCMVAQSLTGRISLLEEKWKELQKTGELTKLDIPETQDEIGHLIHTYNYLVDEIDSLMEEQRKIGEEKKDAMLKALQAQINPHFLYNTLEMISWMIVREDKKKAQEMIRQLSRYYKLVLNKGQDVVTLSHEISLCQAYMEIQSNRFAGKIQFILDISPEIMDIMMPKIILQPLLENAILHGIIPKKEGHGTIWLKTRRESEDLILEVADDGVGFRYENQDRPEDTAGSKYGLYNIRIRLEMYFGRKDCLRVESTPGIGTRMILKLPYKEEAV